MLVLSLMGTASLIAGIALFIWLGSALGGLDRDMAALTRYHPGEATFLYASDGSLLARIANENRIYARLDHIPVALQNATVTAEDRRFWQHSGVDFHGVARALWRDLRTGQPSEGGSTLTMQLVRNVRLSPEKTLKRKVREAALACRLERIYDKPRLLERYLNQVYYGSGAYGVGAAAHTYFGKPVEALTPAQSALLATLPRRPSEDNPYRDPDGSLQRRNRLLKAMVQEGYLTHAQLKNALREPMKLKPRSHPARLAPYFVDAVVDRLTDLYGHQAVYEGGLRVYTTLNPALQRAAESAVRQGVRSLRGRNASQAALLAVDPQSGEVKAMVGGADYAKSAYNRAVTARRQPGSAFKPFVYAAAMEAGYSPTDKITDAPLHLAGWNPKNHYRGFNGQTTLTHAFAESMNIPAIKLALAMGPSRVAEIAKTCGIRSPLEPVPSLALGTSEVSLEELTASYGVFATAGQYFAPSLIRRVASRDGRIQDSFPPFPQSVLSPTTARKVDYLLRQTVETGTGRPVASVVRARGKTGTTQDDKDAWFVGYTPELAAGVWVGNDRPSRMHGVWGGTGCAPIWRSFMAQALRLLPRRPDLPTWSPPIAAPMEGTISPANGELIAGKDSAVDPKLKVAPEWYAGSDASVTKAVANPENPSQETDGAVWISADSPTGMEISPPSSTDSRAMLQRISSRKAMEDAAWPSSRSME